MCDVNKLDIPERNGQFVKLKLGILIRDEAGNRVEAERQLALPADFSSVAKPNLDSI